MDISQLRKKAMALPLTPGVYIMKNKDGETVNVTWHMSDPEICTVTGNDITGAAKGTIIVSADYDGEYYQCTVRVNEQ